MTVSPATTAWLVLAAVGIEAVEPEAVCEGNGSSSGECTLEGPVHPSSISPWADYITETPRGNAKEMAMSAKFINMLNEPVQQFWDDGTPQGKYQGGIHKGEMTHGTYTTHVFFFKTKKGEEVARFTMSMEDPMYIIHGNKPEILASQKYKDYVKEREFLIKYRAENGQPWLSVYPRDPPILNIWPATRLGASHPIVSPHGHWQGGETYSDEYTGALVTVSIKPKVFLIENLLSEAECDHIIEFGKKTVKKSLIGVSEEAYSDDTRTSKTGWINRRDSPQLEHIFKRFAVVLDMDEEQLHPHRNAEPLQIVHYETDQHYYNHFDFFNTGGNKYRFATLLIYLNNGTSPGAGGGTGFPKAFGGKGLKVRPPRGSAVLFYSMMEDGNCDEYSEHTGMHVLEGEKWVANLWIWDPSR